jgi:hypothetical protein
MTKPPSSTIATRILLAVLAVLWFAFGIMVAVDAHPSYRGGSLLMSAMATLSFAAALLLAFLATQITRRGRLGYWLAVTLLASMALVGLLDELGLADLVFLVLTLLPLILLLKDRRWYLSPTSRTDQNDPAA